MIYMLTIAFIYLIVSNKKILWNMNVILTAYLSSIFQTCWRLLLINFIYL